MPQLLQNGCSPRYSWHVSRDEDYSLARVKTKVIKRHKAWERGYALATHFVEEIVSRRKETVSLESTFRENVDRWHRETGHLSSIPKAITHPSYLRIIGLSRLSSGYELERLLLKELELEPDHWFAALTAITGEDPVKTDHDFDQAIEDWLSWGRERGII